MGLANKLNPAILETEHELAALHDDLHPGAAEQYHGVHRHHAQLPHEHAAGLDLLVEHQVRGLKVAHGRGDRAGVDVDIPVLVGLELQILGAGRLEHGAGRSLLVLGLGCEHLHDVGVERGAEDGGHHAVVVIVDVDLGPGHRGHCVPAAAAPGGPVQVPPRDVVGDEADAGEQLRELVLHLADGLQRLLAQVVLLAVHPARLLPRGRRLGPRPVRAPRRQLIAVPRGELVARLVSRLPLLEGRHEGRLEAEAGGDGERGVEAAEHAAVQHQLANPHVHRELGQVVAQGAEALVRVESAHCAQSGQGGLDTLC